jgi:uridylate kinase
MKKYKRILLKISGESIANDGVILDTKILNKIISIIKSVLKQNIELAIVIGGGNIIRGKDIAKLGIDNITGDYMGMLSTVINALAIADTCNKNNIDNIIMSGFPIGGGLCEQFNHIKAKQELSKKKIVIFSAGTGNPCFTTDTAAALRGIEIDADIIFKATKVDGVYTNDPIKNPDAKRYKNLSFDEAIEKELNIMDISALTLCRDNSINICVFSIFEDTNILSNILQGEDLGTMISN